MQGKNKTEILLKTVSWDMLIHPSHSEISTNFLSAFVGKEGNKAEDISLYEVTGKLHT